MNLKQLLFLTVIPIFSTSLSYSQTKFVEQKAGHIIYMSVPDYMTKTTSLNDVASMQYMNKTKEAYVVVIEDAKEDLEAEGTKYNSLKEFHDSVIEILKSEDPKAEESKPTEFQQNGNKFYQTDLYATLQTEDGKDIKVTYLVIYVESKTHYYQILCWTLASSYKDLVADFKKTASTIRD
jgi:hypothetical protein